ncbi:MAG: zinc ribbon domain-containing protein [Formivibrio sp.]|nr:zinc ribbon domain-containing protein [Formivibrio sp.]
MTRLCPNCQAPLEYQIDHWHCHPCKTDYRLRGLCNTCGAELEYLAACGATNWFCPQCNELKSKSVVQTDLVAIT